MATFLKAAQYEPKTPQEHTEGVSLLLPLEHRSGYVFVLAHLSKKHATNPALNATLTKHAEDLARSFGKDANIQHRFEQFLGGLNDTLAQTVREGHISLPIRQFHAAVGIICDDRLFFSGTGELTALFLHRKPSQRYQVFNLFRGIQTEQALPTWEKAFAVVLDGELQDGDVFCVSQKDLQRHIPQDDLNSILTALPPTGATEKIRQCFAAHDSLQLIILKTETVSSVVPETYAKPLADISIDSFIRGQDETARLLEDQRPNLLETAKVLTDHFIKPTGPQSRILNDLQRGEPRLKILWRATQSLGQYLFKTVRFFPKRAFNRLSSLKSQDSGAILKDQAQKTIHQLRRLPLRSKRGLQLAGVLVLVLGMGLFGLSYLNTQSSAQKAFDDELAAIQVLIDRAGGAMIYKDENQSRTLYQQATQRLTELAPSNNAQKEKVEAFTKQINVAMNELRHVVTITEPAVLAHIESTSGTQINGQQLIASGTNLFVVDDQQFIWRIDPSKKQITALTTTPLSSSPIVDVTEENGVLFALDSSQQLLRINSTDGSSTRISWSPVTTGSLTALQSYASRFYVLERTNDDTDANLLRYDGSGTNYGSGTSWITTKSEPIAKARSLAVDGGIYVLRENGIVQRFQSGAQLNWQLGVTEPAVTNATRIWTSNASRFIYLLEPSTKRLLVYRKDTGAFVVQYTSDRFDHASAFRVDESAKTIYLLSGPDVFTFHAGHL